MQQTTNGGYILGGYSNSNISGDKTENSKGFQDISIVKTDSLGNIMWQNTIGGSSAVIYPCNKLLTGDIFWEDIQLPTFRVIKPKSPGISRLLACKNRLIGQHYVAKYPSGEVIQENISFYANKPPTKDILREENPGLTFLVIKQKTVKGDYDFWLVKLTRQL